MVRVAKADHRRQFILSLANLRVVFVKRRDIVALKVPDHSHLNTFEN